MLTLSHPPAPLTCTSPALDCMPMAALPIIPPRHLSQRPKLSVNTEQPRILGKAASLRLDTLSAVSPTVRNTFANAYEQPSTAPALARPSKPRLSIDSHLPPANPSTPPAASTPASSTLALTPASASASSQSAPLAVPYKQPHNIASILVNSPAPPILARKMAAARLLFPAAKRVSFRTPLEENITTVTYTLAHSDLQSSSSTLSSITSTTSTASETSDESETPGSHLPEALHAPTDSNGARLSLPPPSEQPESVPSTAATSPRSKAPRVGDKRDSSSSEDDGDSCPETPVAGRRKRRRDWRWTLGPLAGPDKAASLTGDATTSDESC